MTKLATCEQARAWARPRQAGQQQQAQERKRQRSAGVTEEAVPTGISDSRVTALSAAVHRPPRNITTLNVSINTSTSRNRLLFFT
jgi:response regulator of citrate/malate metabolism